jgi:hypothetical protein
MIAHADCSKHDEHRIFGTHGAHFSQALGAISNDMAAAK